MVKRRSRPMKVPDEFYTEMKRLTDEFSSQTGFPPNMSATQRRLARFAKKKLIVKKGEFDVRII